MSDKPCKRKEQGEISVDEDDDADIRHKDRELKSERNEGYLCRYCLVLKKTSQRLREHILQHHLGPAKCDMCGFDMADIMDLKEHKKICGYPCSVKDCDLRHKTLISADNHMKKLLKSI